MFSIAVIAAISAAGITPPSHTAPSELDMNARGQLVTWARILTNKSTITHGPLAATIWRQRLADGTTPRRVPVFALSAGAMGYVGDAAAGDVDIVRSIFTGADADEADGSAVSVWAHSAHSSHSAFFACIAARVLAPSMGRSFVEDARLPGEMVAIVLESRISSPVHTGPHAAAAASLLTLSAGDETELAPLATDTALAWTIAR